MNILNIKIKKGNYSNINGLIVLGIAAVLLGAALFLWYIGRNKDVIIRQNEDYIMDSSATAALRVDDELEHGEILIFNLAQGYAHILKDAEDKSISEILKVLNYKTVFDRVVFITPDGINHSMEGNAKVGDREYFVEGMKGNTGRQWLSKSRITGKGSIIFYTPVRDGKDVVGVLAGHFEKSHMDSLLHTEFMGVAPETILMDEIGNILASSQEKTGLADYGNLFRAIVEKNVRTTLSETTVKNIIAANKNRPYDKKEKINWNLNDKGEVTIMSMVPLRSHGWYVVQVLPASITKEMTRDINFAGIILTAMLMFMFATVSVIIYYLISKQKDELKEAVKEATINSRIEIDKLRDSYKYEKQYRESFIANSRLNYSVNLTKDILLTELVDVQVGEIRKMLPMIGLAAPCSYSEMVKKWGETFIEDEQYKLDFLRYNDRQYLLDRFNEGDRDVYRVWKVGENAKADKYRDVFQNIIMTENKDGDVMALVVLKDIKL